MAVAGPMARTSQTQLVVIAAVVQPHAWRPEQDRARGRINTWACGVVYAVGAANFLFDPAQTPHMRGSDVCAAFGVSASAGAAKGREIMRMFHIGQLDPQWCLPSKLADNPLAWFVEINGFVVDARHLARDVQEELHRRGLIPFVLGEPGRVG